MNKIQNHQNQWWGKKFNQIIQVWNQIESSLIQNIEMLKIKINGSLTNVKKKNQVGFA